MSFDTLEKAALSTVNKNGSTSDWALVYCEERDGQGLAILQESGREPNKQVLCMLTPDGWRLVCQSDSPGFISYNNGKTCALETFIWKVPDGAHCAHLRIDGDELELPIINDHVYYVFWDLSEPQVGRWWTYPYPDFELWVDFEQVWRYHDMDIFHTPAAARAFCQAHYRQYRDNRPQDDWVSGFSYGQDLDKEELFSMLMLLVSSVENPVQDADYLLYIGAGPLEGLFGDWLLTRLESMGQLDPRLQIALAGARLDFEPLEMRERAKLLMGPYGILPKAVSKEDLQKEAAKLLAQAPVKRVRERKDKNIRIGRPRPAND